MGCDYYMITCLKIEYKDLRNDGKPYIDYIDLDTTRKWFLPVDGEDTMTEEEYDECEAKYEDCEEPFTIFENDNFATDKLRKYYTSKGGWLADIDLSRVNNVKRIQYAMDRS